MKKEISQYVDQSKTEADQLNLKIIELNQKNSDLQNQLEGKQSQIKKMQNVQTDKDAKVATYEAEIERLKSEKTSIIVQPQSSYKPMSSKPESVTKSRPNSYDNQDLLEEEILEETKSVRAVSPKLVIQKKYRVDDRQIKPILMHLRLFLQEKTIPFEFLNGMLDSQGTITQDKFQERLDNLNFA